MAALPVAVRGQRSDIVTAPDANEILTPSSLNRMVRQLLDEVMPMVWVEGELSNVARPASGHVYFSLKDSGAQLRCAMFRNRSAALTFRPADGLHVRVQGRVGLYEPRGDYQLIVERMKEAGEGALQRAYEQLKRKLAAEGVLASERKRPLPAFVRRLAVITSPSGAAIRDVLTVIGRRFPMLPVDVLPSPVQGAEAVPVLRERLRAVNAAGKHDLILITRGGGSLEDLWAFNDEQLARDIAASPIVVVAAIGHEVDTTLAELAADLRAPTPSAAAEAITPDGAALARQVAHLGQRLRREIGRGLQIRGQRVDSTRLRLASVDPRRQLERIRERAGQAHRQLQRLTSTGLERRRHRLDRALAALQRHRPDQRIALARVRLSQLTQRLRSGERQQRLDRVAHLRELGRALNAVSPLATLDRGYAIVMRPEDGRLLASAAAIAGESTVTARLFDGQIDLDVRTGSLHPKPT